MADSTLTRLHLSEAVFTEVGLSRYESSQLVESVLTHISEALIRNEVVKISSFGTFSTRNKRPRIGRNPKTGAVIQIAAKNSVKFKAGAELSSKVN